MPRNNLIFLHAVLIMTLGFCMYANSLEGKFIWDDEILVVNNPYIKNLSLAKNIFTKDIGVGGGKEYHFYRPIQMFTYVLDYRFWKSNPKGYHLTNIFLHSLTAVLIYLLVTLLFKNMLVSFCASALFVTQPIHTEAVSYISGRADILVAVFILLSFIFYIMYIEGKKSVIYPYFWFLISYCSALLSKECALVFPTVLFFYHYVFKVKVKLKNFSPVLLVIFFYFLLRVTFFGSLVSYQDKISTTLIQRLPGFFAALSSYTRLLFLPFNLHMEYGNYTSKFLSVKVILGILIFILLTVIVLKNRRNNLIFFSGGWFFLLLLPQSNIFPLNAYMAEHWLYLPALGFFIILAQGINYLYRLKNFRFIAIGLLLSLLFFYSILTVKQNEYWKNSISFYEMTLRYAPNSVRVVNNLGKEYKNSGKYKEAEAFYKKALELNPNFYEAYINLGLLYHDLKQYEEAISSYLKAIQINFADPVIYNNLGNSHKELGQYKEAADFYQKTISFNPDYVEAYDNLGIVLYTFFGKKEEALGLFQRAVAINPDFADAHNNLAVAYFYKKEYGLAIKHCDKAMALGYKVDHKFLQFLELFR